MPVSQAEVVEALRPVQDPELRRSIVELGMVREITVTGASVGVQVALTVPGCPLKAEITAAVEMARHPPMIISTGAPFVTAELKTCDDEL